MRGWLALSICGEGDRVYGPLQLSDKSRGREFDAAEMRSASRELAALVGETLDALRATASIS